MSIIKQQIMDDLKAAMKAGEAEKRDTIRLITSEFKKFEVDNRGSELGDAQVLAILEKMLKSRRDSVSQFRAAGREDLAVKEEAEMKVIAVYLPAQLSEAEVDAAINAAIAETGAATAKDMGKLMAVLKPQLAGKADMQAVSARVKAKLG